MTFIERQSLLRTMFANLTVGIDGVKINVKNNGFTTTKEAYGNFRSTNKQKENGDLEIYLPFICRRLSRRKHIVEEQTGTPHKKAVARAFYWQKIVDSGKFTNILEFAKAIGQNPSNAAKTLRLNCLAPDIIHRILIGRIPDILTLSSLRMSIPEKWKEQRKVLLEK